VVVVVAVVLGRTIVLESDVVVVVVVVLGRTISVNVAVVVTTVILGMVVIKESVSVPVGGRVESTTLDFIISGSVRRQQFAGYHPRSLIALLLVITLPNDEFHTIFTSECPPMRRCVYVLQKRNLES